MFISIVCKATSRYSLNVGFLAQTAEYAPHCIFVVLVRNLLRHSDVPEGVQVYLEEVNGWMEETLEALREGENE